MSAQARQPVGLVVGSALTPEQFRQMAVEGEDLGFGELWVVEDYFFHGGIADAAVALSATSRVPVGIGVLSGLVRHPAVLAMELATLARMFPGRLRPGIGLGVPSWIEQMGFRPKSPISVLRECVTSVRTLLDGGELNTQGANYTFNNVCLTYPVAERLPLDLGVIGPKMLRLSGEIADGTIGSVLAGTKYISWARGQISAGISAAGREDKHRFTAYALFCVDNDGRKAKAEIRELLAFYLAAVPTSALCDVYGITEELIPMAKGGVEQIIREMPDRWVEDLAIAGDPDECAEKIGSFLAAGADSVALFPPPGDRVFEIARTAGRDVLPRVRQFERC